MNYLHHTSLELAVWTYLDKSGWSRLNKFISWTDVLVANFLKAYLLLDSLSKGYNCLAQKNPQEENKHDRPKPGLTDVRTIS
uniref:Uncharacterized protein n=1 Tax=Tetraselmis sp. GSL018 TaxID=582737 RepID=A0A061RVJ8_9CHLO